MTKKPSDKNKTWEKERRDRLNKAYDDLVKLLPQYDPSIVWSKNEIIQRAVTYIEELQTKHKSLLEKHDLEALRDFKDLLDTVKFFRSRNSQLVELLKKAKITIPPTKFPKFVADNPKLGENQTVEIISRPVGRPRKYANKITATPNQLQFGCKNCEKKVICNSEENRKSPENGTAEEAIKSHANVKPAVSQNAVNVATSTTAAITTTTTEAIISTGILLPVISCKPATLLPTRLSTTGRPLFTIPSNSAQPKCKILSVQTLPRLKSVLPARDKDGKIKILPRPVYKLYLRGENQKIPIVPLKRSVVKIKRKPRRRQIRKQSMTDATKDAKRARTKSSEHLSSTEKISNLVEKTISESTKNQTFTLLPNIDSSNDYFPALQIPENNTSPTSPTAAFLLSFPVVSGNNGPSGSDNNKCPNSIEREKSHSQDDLENLKNFFNTKEYHKYCKQTSESGEDLIALANSDKIPMVTKTADAKHDKKSIESKEGTTEKTHSQSLGGLSSTNSDQNTIAVEPVIKSTYNPSFVSTSIRPSPLPCISKPSTSPASHTTKSALSTKRPTVLPFNQIPEVTQQHSSNFFMSNIFTTNVPTTAITKTTYSLSTNNLPAISDTVKYPVAADRTTIKTAKIIPPAVTSIALPPPNNLSTSSSSSKYDCNNSLINSRPELQTDLLKSSTTMTTTRISTIPNPIPVALPQTTTFSVPALYQSTRSFQAENSIFASPMSRTASVSINSSGNQNQIFSNASAASSVSNVVQSQNGQSINSDFARSSEPSLMYTGSNHSQKAISTVTTTPTFPFPKIACGLPSDTTKLYKKPDLHHKSLFPVTSSSQSSITPYFSEIDPTSGLSSIPKISTSNSSTTAGCYYFPPAAPVASPSFTFNLTSTTPTVTTSTMIDSAFVDSSFLSHSNTNQNVQWMPPSSTIASYKPTFTFTLTSCSTTNSTNQSTIGKRPNRSKDTLASLTKASDSVSETTTTSLPPDKRLNTGSKAAKAPSNFAFSLNPQQSTPLSSNVGSSCSSSIIDSKYKPLYPGYSFQNYSTTFPKDTTNFTFALTKPVQSFSTSFSLDHHAASSSASDCPQMPSTSQTIVPLSDYELSNNLKTNFYQPIKSDSFDSFNQNHAKATTRLNHKTHVNWMTSTTASQQVAQPPNTAYYPASQIVPSFDFNNKMIFPTSSSAAIEDHITAAWPPPTSKALDPNQMVQSVVPFQNLPNYYNNDLTSLSSISAYEPTTKMCSKIQEKSHPMKTCKPLTTNSNQASFFSVSQLVEPNTTKNNSKKISQKPIDYRKNYTIHENSYNEHKSSSLLNNYSAEALISKDQKHRNYSPPLHPYSNTTEYYHGSHNDVMNNIYLPQDNDNFNYNPNYFYNYMPTNQNLIQDSDYSGSHPSGGGGDLQYAKTTSSYSQKLMYSGKTEKKYSNEYPVSVGTAALGNSNHGIASEPTISVMENYDPQRYSQNNHHHNIQSSIWNHSVGTGVSQHLSDDLNMSGCNPNTSNNLTNFNVSSICPEIDGKVEPTNW